MPAFLKFTVRGVVRLVPCRIKSRDLVLAEDTDRMHEFQSVNNMCTGADVTIFCLR